MLLLIVVVLGALQPAPESGNPASNAGAYDYTKLRYTKTESVEVAGRYSPGYLRAAQPLDFKQVFRRGVIPAVAPAGQALGDALRPEQVSEILTDILDAAIRVKDTFGLRDRSPPERFNYL